MTNTPMIEHAGDQALREGCRETVERLLMAASMIDRATGDARALLDDVGEDYDELRESLGFDRVELVLRVLRSWLGDRYYGVGFSDSPRDFSKVTYDELRGSIDGDRESEETLGEARR